MTKRLLLDLRQVSRGTSSHGHSTLPELAFASNVVLGNLGAPLRQSIGEVLKGDGEMDNISYLTSEEQCTNSIPTKPKYVWRHSLEGRDMGEDSESQLDIIDIVSSSTPEWLPVAL